ncbi:YbjN domain-containing protein [Pseudomonas putida]|uniref:YbjN domain-containing protein n=1 Tax=Pseudomonas putida TaxID=303 RepID=A0A1Q9R4F9_PSEPU|nr:YbjN domain-containing protein [Pseudomonas putida]OLS62287.1 hypothetical protein PSEMO_27510 [Pseudomonas putida]
MTEATLIEVVTADSMTTLLQDAGCRVNRIEQNQVVQLQTASQGIGYSVRFGNHAREQGEFLDFTYSCALRVQGEIPENLVNQWNISRRFARLSSQGEFLVLEQDVVVADGVSPKNLLGSLVLWDRVLQEFVIYLRDFSRNLAAAQAAAEANAS